MKDLCFFVLIAVLPFESSSQALSECPEGWQFYSFKCYKLLEAAQSWDDAHSKCADAGGNLASVQSKQENSFLLKFAGKIPAALGARDINKDGIWTWSDGSPWGEFLNWGRNQPNGIDGDRCVKIGASGSKWTSDNCATKSKAICEKTCFPGNKCPPGWKFFQSKCYKRLQKSLSWKMAADKCVKLGSKLASANSAEECNFLCSMTQNRPTWLGGSYLSSEDVWSWADNSEWKYTNWEENEPDSVDRRYCLEINGKSGGKWNTVSCDRRVNAICEKTLFPALCSCINPFLGKPNYRDGEPTSTCSGKVVTNCEFCYVDPLADCRDKKPALGMGRYWSKLACSFGSEPAAAAASDALSS